MPSTTDVWSACEQCQYCAGNNPVYVLGPNRRLPAGLCRRSLNASATALLGKHDSAAAAAAARKHDSTGCHAVWLA
jgi:hypothetical protein